MGRRLTSTRVLSVGRLVPDAELADNKTIMGDEYSGKDRRSAPKSDRRSGRERRSGLDRRRGPGRRRSDYRRAAEEGEITGDMREFIMTIDEYKRVNARPFPTYTEIFEIMQYLGYRKVAEKARHINELTDEPPQESS